MVALELTPVPVSAHTLTAFGRSDEYLQPFTDYPVPEDLDVGARLYRANCGPASFAAVAGLLVTDIIRFFPQFPESPHTNIPQMKSALSQCGICEDEMSEEWPKDGLCLIQITGPWTERAWSHSACGHRHWVAVRNGYVYELNENAWMERADWIRLMNERAASHSRSTGWRLLKSLQLVVQPTYFPEYSCG